MWGGLEQSRTSASRLPSWNLIFAGTLSVKVRYVVLNQKWRASDLKSLVGIPVATTMRPVRIDPRSVKTSAVFRPNVIRFTGEPSNTAAPRALAADASPMHARYGSRVAPALLRRPPAVSSANPDLTARALSNGASNPASRRAF